MPTPARRPGRDTEKTQQYQCLATITTRRRQRRSRMHRGESLAIGTTGGHAFLAVVLVGDEVTLKKVYYKNDLMILEATNPEYESRFFTKQEVVDLPVRIMGVVRFVRRDFS